MRSQHTICRAILVLALLLLSGATAFPYSSRAAGPWYVAPGGKDSNNCLNPSTPCETINGAIDKAASGDTIYVAGGTYTGSGNEVVLLDKGAMLFGGWDSSFSQRNEESVIDGQDERAGVRVAEEATVFMDSFTVQNSLDFGIVSGGTLTVFACDVRNNSGHGIYNQNGTLTVSYSRVRDNIYGADGVGLENANGTMTIDHSLVTGNVLYNPGISGGGGGAGIYHHNSGNTVIRDSTISNNQIAGGFNGSGIACGGYTTIAIVNTTIAGNSGGGSAIYSFVGAFDIRSSTITDNDGGIRNQAGQFQIQNTILARNGELDCYNDSAYPNGSVQSLGYNLFGSLIDCSTIGADAVNFDLPALPWAADGTALPTRALVPPNPAINGGNPAGCTDSLGNVLASDERGQPRFGRCDIGAYELQPLGFSTKVPGDATIQPLHPVTYTIGLQNDGFTDIHGARLTDTLPISLAYTSGSLAATSGAAAYADGVITWAGTVSAGSGVSVTFEAGVGAEFGPIHNHAIISGNGETYTRTATIHVLYPVLQLAPHSGMPGSEVRIQSAGFTTGSTVTFGVTTLPPADVTYVAPTQLRALVPAGTGLAPVGVTTASEATSAHAFSVLAPLDGKKLWDVTARSLPVRLSRASSGLFADADNDADLDLFVGEYVETSELQRRMRLFVNDGTGRFTDETDTRMPAVPGNPRLAQAGDIDGDGDLDILPNSRVFSGDPLSDGSLLINDGSGNFSDEWSSRVPRQQCERGVLGDVDGDADLDLLLPCRYSGNDRQLFLNDGSGHFKQGGAFSVPSEGDVFFALGDVDDDGDLDAFGAWAMGSTSYRADLLYVNDGHGNFADETATRLPDSSGYYGLQPALADLDGDRDLDGLIVGPWEHPDYLLVNDGTGHFSRSPHQLPSIPATSWLGGAELGDIDSDGDTDLVLPDPVSTGSADTASLLLLNQGDMRFESPSPWWYGSLLGACEAPWGGGDYCQGVALGDVNGDGTLDLFLALGSEYSSFQSLLFTYLYTERVYLPLIALRTP